MRMLLLLGCSPTPTCPAGYDAGDDGRCYAETTAGPVATVDDLIASLPACTIDGTTDGAIALAAGCAGGGCAGDSYTAMNTAYGEVGHCGGSVSNADESVIFASCDWSIGLWTSWALPSASA